MAHAGHTLTGPKPNNWISIFFWAYVRSLAFVCSSVTWLLPQWRKHRIGLRLIVGLRLFVCHVAASVRRSIECLVLGSGPGRVYQESQSAHAGHTPVPPLAVW